MNREHRLRMTLENHGGGPAQNVVVDIQIAPAERIRVEMPMGLRDPNPPRVWETDDYENSYVKNGEAHVRQRVAQINPKSHERLDPIGIVLPKGHPRPCYRVGYRLTDTQGLRLEGEFQVEVKWDHDETIEPESRSPF